MTANTFEIKKFSAEIRTKDKKEIKTFVTLDRDSEPDPIKKFSTFEEAMEELKKPEYKPSCRYYSGWAVPFYMVEEYVIECYEADEDGEFISGSDFDAFWKFKFDSDLDGIKIL